MNKCKNCKSKCRGTRCKTCYNKKRKSIKENKRKLKQKKVKEANTIKNFCLINEQEQKRKKLQTQKDIIREDSITEEEWECKMCYLEKNETDFTEKGKFYTVCRSCMPRFNSLQTQLYSKYWTQMRKNAGINGKRNVIK